MLLSSTFYRPPVRPEHHLVEFTCRVCGKVQVGRKNQKVCPGREGECRKAWQAGVSKRSQEKARERRKREKEKREKEKREKEKREKETKERERDQHARN